MDNDYDDYEGGRVPPQAVEVEEAVLGAMLIEYEAADIAVSMLSDSDFYKNSHKTIFKCLKGLYDENQPLDLLTVENELRDKELLDSIGGAGYLSELTRSVSSAANIDYHAQIIYEKATKRNLILGCTDIIKEAYDSTSDPYDVLDKAYKTISYIMDEGDSSSITSLSDALVEAVDRNMKVADGEIDLGLKTGLDIDDRVGGYEDGKFYVIAARPAMGKSAYALHIMKALASQGVPVGMFSLEMTDMSLANRLLVNAMDIDGMRIRNGDITDEEKDIMFNAASDIHDLPIFFDDNPSLTSGLFRARANTFKRTHEVGALVIDYLQIMEGGGKEESRHRELAEMARNCKKVAKDLDIPVIALSQLSRGVDNRNDKRPVKSDLRGSGGIEEAADCIQFLYRPSEYNRKQYSSSEPFSGSTENICEIIVGKNREGRTGIEQQLFFANKMRFENLNYKHS